MQNGRTQNVLCKRCCAEEDGFHIAAANENMGTTSKRFFVDGTAGHMTDYMVSIPKKETDVKPFRIKKVKRIKNGQKKMDRMICRAPIPACTSERNVV